MSTHLVTNQPPPFEGGNFAERDHGLIDALGHFGAEHELHELRELGALAGEAQTLALGEDANRFPPQLQTHDRFGHRIDEVRFHPAWHQLLAHATHFGLHGAPWRETDPHAHLLRAAKFYVWSQVEAGHGCPISMTYAAIPALRLQPELARIWEPRFTHRAYEAQLAPIAQKSSALCGMALTEKQGGSDVRANTTHAVPQGARGPGNPYLLTGHKWFCSAPMSDAFLVLAQTDAGLSCFLLPRILPDGTRNGLQLQRLKEKLGNRSNASSEIEFDGATAWLIGDEGRGVHVIVEMINHTRLDCILGSSGLLRIACAQAIHHAQHRSAFGTRLIEQPLMENVLADLALESEAATLLAMRIAHAADRAPHDAQNAALKRIGTAIGKYWVCKRAPAAIGEALEVLGGNGYVEESMLPRLYREAPVNSLWEGPGNVNALDVLRILGKKPEAFEALRNEWQPALTDSTCATAAREIESWLAPAPSERGARFIAERLALLWQAALMLRYAPAASAQAFIASRIAGTAGRAFGTLRTGAFREIVNRASPNGDPA